jgi:hypothetical protein
MENIIHRARHLNEQIKYRSQYQKKKENLKKRKYFLTNNDI